jgi:hypothetical protein
MEYIEFSFIGFEDSVVYNPSVSKSMVLSMQKNLKFPVLYTSITQLSGLDCRDTISNLEYGLKVRLSEFPLRKQVVIILYDNINIEKCCIQTKSYNNATFTSDLRNWRPKNEKIKKSHELNSILSSSTPPIDDFEELKIQSKYLDNYIYYLSIKKLQKIGCYCLLVYLPLSINISAINLLCSNIYKSIIDKD